MLHGVVEDDDDDDDGGRSCFGLIRRRRRSKTRKSVDGREFERLDGQTPPNDGLNEKQRRVRNVLEKTRQQLTKLEEKERQFHTQSAEHLVKAKAHLKAGHQLEAKSAMRWKKQCDENLKTTQNIIQNTMSRIGKLETYEMQSDYLEMASELVEVSKQMMGGVQGGEALMAKADDVMETLREQHEELDFTTDSLSRTFESHAQDATAKYDDDELLAELAEEMADEPPAPAPALAVTAFPRAPTAVPTTAELAAAPISSSFSAKTPSKTAVPAW